MLHYRLIASIVISGHKSKYYSNALKCVENVLNCRKHEILVFAINVINVHNDGINNDNIHTKHIKQ